MTIPQDDLDALKAESESVSKDYGYTETWHTTCIKDLGIDESRFKEDRSVAELAYANFLQNNSRVDDWFNLDVILIVCLYVCTFCLFLIPWQAVMIIIFLGLV